MKKKHFWEHHVIGIISTNCYIFGDPSNAILFDPGGSEVIQLVQSLKEKGIEVKHVIATHGHFDHLAWATEVQKYLSGSLVYLHKDEKVAYQDFHRSMIRYGLQPPTLREPDRWVEDGQILDLSGYKLKVIHTPGHSPGSATFQLVEVPNSMEDHLIPQQLDHAAFVGDLLFQGSIGRSDLPYSNQKDMIRSLEKIMQLSPSTKIYPGHGSFTELSTEMNSNPFLLAIQRGISIF